MKINIEVDLTPEEARELFGLPNIQNLHEIFLKTAQEKMGESAKQMDIDPMIKAWSGFGNIAQEAFGTFMNSAINAASTTTTTKPKTKE